MTNKKRKVLTTITKWSSIALAMTTLVLMVAYSTAGQKELQAEPKKEPVHVVQAGEKELPNTGAVTSVVMYALGVLGLSGAVYTKRRTK